MLSLSLFMFVWHSCLAHEMFCCRTHLLFLKGWCDVRAGAVTSPVLHHLSPDANTVCCLKCVGTAFPKKKTPLNEGVTTSFITNQPIVYWCWIRVEQLLGYQAVKSPMFSKKERKIWLIIDKLWKIRALMIYQLLGLSINRKYIAIYFDNQVFVSF